MSSLELGIIGNGSVAALIDDHANFAFMCLPRFDSPPAFDKLMGGDGICEVEVEDFERAEQSYIKNTAVLRTVLYTTHGSAVEILDFCPRFQARGRVFRPTSFVRRIMAVAGKPRVTIKVKPTNGWTGEPMVHTRGSNHMRFVSEQGRYRLTTDAPVSYIQTETPFTLDAPIAIIMGPDEPLSDAPDVIARDWEERTTDYWREWARRLAVPFEYQSAVIRAAITLKMCVYEETGGIVAALTTSIPEHEGSQRNWDYRFCWIRDAYFTVTALNRLSSMSTLEYYLRYLRNVAAMTKGGHIQPVYGVGLESALTERIVERLPGYRGHGPVRDGNQAAEHIQHDVYGQVVLGAAQAFLDERLIAPAQEDDFELLEAIGERAFLMHDQPDAGIWEYRTRAAVHTSSTLMCWAACDRLSLIAEQLGHIDRSKEWRKKAEIIRDRIEAEAWSEERGAYTGAFGGNALDASVLLMGEVGYADGSSERFRRTVELINTELREGNVVYRYKEADDFGTPSTAFTACTFWLIDALAMLGRKDEARELFEYVLEKRTKLGLLSEDMDTATGDLWGNFPQTYSMVGIINSACRLSRSWMSVI